MQIVIDIPEEDYNDIITCNPEVETEYVLDLLMKCVDNGTPFEQIKESIHEILFELSDGGTYLDVERQKVESKIFEIIDNR